MYRVYILKTMSLNFTQKNRAVALPCVVSDYTIAIKLNYPTDPRKKVRVPNISCDRSKINKCQLKLIVSKNKTKTI